MWSLTEGGLTKDLQRQKGIHRQYTRLISLLERHVWSIFREHTIVALQDTCMPIKMIKLKVIMNAKVVL